MSPPQSRLASSSTSPSQHTSPSPSLSSSTSQLSTSTKIIKPQFSWPSLIRPSTEDEMVSEIISLSLRVPSRKLDAEEAKEVTIYSSFISILSLFWFTVHQPLLHRTLETSQRGRYRFHYHGNQWANHGIQASILLSSFVSSFFFSSFSWLSQSKRPSSLRIPSFRWKEHVKLPLPSIPCTQLCPMKLVID